MNIWLIQIGETLPLEPGIRKLRTAYLADELTQRGHNVIWWGSAFDHFKKKWVYNGQGDVKVDDKLTLKLLRGIGYKKNISISRFIDHRLIAKRFARSVKQMVKPDVIVASMPSYDLSYEAVKYANKNRIPILVDIRDQWPDIFLEKAPYVPKALMRLLLHNEFRLLRGTFAGASALTSMMNTLLDWGVAYTEREKTKRDRVFYLGYSRARKPGNDSGFSLDAKIKGKFIVTFIGTFGEYHNPSSLIECAKKLEGQKDIHFVLAGDGHLMSRIQNAARSLQNVTFTGWIGQSEITSLLQCSHVGVCTTSKKAYFFPNKAFAYLSEGLPIISAFEGDLRDMIKDKSIGFYYPPDDVEALSDCILKLYQDPAFYKKTSDKATLVFDQILDANIIYKNYADHIECVYKECNNATLERVKG